MKTKSPFAIPARVLRACADYTIVRRRHLYWIVVDGKKIDYRFTLDGAMRTMIALAKKSLTETRHPPITGECTAPHGLRH